MKPRALTKLGRIASLVSVLVALGCGSIDPHKAAEAGNGGEGGTAGEGSGASAGDGGSPPASPAGALLPWATGNTWQYLVTQEGTVTSKTTTVGDFGPVGGDGPHAEAAAFHVVTMKGTHQQDRTESWQAPASNNPERVVRFREQAFGAQTGELELEEYWDPPRIHVDGTPGRIFTGSTWSESYEETKLEVGRTPLRHTVTEIWIVISDDETVSVPAGEFEHAIHLRKTSNGQSKDYWYLRGIGKLKEVGAQTEELTDFTIVAEDAP
jgi:hypothetical protein